MEVFVFASLKKTEKEGEEELLLKKSDVELKDISDLADDNERILKFMVCIYNMLSLFGIDDDSIKEIVESGGLDRVPKRFQKMRDYKY